MKERPALLKGFVLGSLFFEPSTRTRLSFDSAFMRLGGAVSSVTEGTSSLLKGESLADMSRVVSGYYDCMVVRHGDSQAVKTFIEYATVPVINAGSGAEEHPTQALLDVYTMICELRAHGKTLEGAKVVCVGDVKHARSVHSLFPLLRMFNHVEVTCVTTPDLRASGSEPHVSSLEEALPDADVVYMTRLQAERHQATHVSPFILNKKCVDSFCSREVVLMHPLPRGPEMDSDLDEDQRLSIFRQTRRGVALRMALFLLILGQEGNV